MKRLMRRFMKPDPRECEAVRELMSEYVDEELATDDRARVHDHVGICPRCRQVLGNLRITLERVGLLSEEAPADADESDDVAERITQAWRTRH